MNQIISHDPFDTGYAIGFSMKQVPFLEQVSDDQLMSLSLLSLTPDDLRKERYLICMAAALCTIRSSLQDSNQRNAAVEGYQACLATHVEKSLYEFLQASSFEACDYYQSAADDDGEIEWAAAGEVSEIELAFGDRLFNRSPREETGAATRACLALTMVTPRTIWNLQRRMSHQMLVDAKLITLQ